MYSIVEHWITNRSRFRAFVRRLTFEGSGKENSSSRVTSQLIHVIKDGRDFISSQRSRVPERAL